MEKKYGLLVKLNIPAINQDNDCELRRMWPDNIDMYGIYVNEARNLNNRDNIYVLDFINERIFKSSISSKMYDIITENSIIDDNFLNIFKEDKTEYKFGKSFEIYPLKDRIKHEELNGVETIEILKQFGIEKIIENLIRALMALESLEEIEQRIQEKYENSRKNTGKNAPRVANNVQSPVNSLEKTRQKLESYKFVTADFAKQDFREDIGVYFEDDTKRKDFAGESEQLIPIPPKSNRR